MKKNKFTLLAAVAVVTLSLSVAACTSAPPMTLTQPDLTFAQMQEIPLAVAKIEIFDDYKPPMGGNNIEHEFATPPSVAAKNLIQSKLRAAGDRQVLRVFIDDASVRGEKLPVRTDFQGFFTREVSERFVARVALRFELVNEDAPDIVIGRANVSSDRTSSLVENASLADRDVVYTALTEALMRDLYEGFSTTVRGNFGMQR